MRNIYSHKFHTPKGLLVYVPTDEGREAGERIVERVMRIWHPPSHFFHFKRGGHVAAAQHHLAGTWFARLDIRSFFDSVTRSKIHRALMRLHVPHAEAWDILTQSTVRKAAGPGYTLPFGFVQSPVLASVALDRSAVGACFRTAKRSGVRLSVYVDDILISSPDAASLRAYVQALHKAASASGYSLNEDKSQVAVPSVEAFNLRLAHRHLEVTPERIMEFERVERTATLAREIAIIGYVGTVNPSQAGMLRATYGL